MTAPLALSTPDRVHTTPNAPHRPTRRQPPLQDVREVHGSNTSARPKIPVGDSVRGWIVVKSPLPSFSTRQVRASVDGTTTTTHRSMVRSCVSFTVTAHEGERYVPPLQQVLIDCRGSRARWASAADRAFYFANVTFSVRTPWSVASRAK